MPDRIIIDFGDEQEKKQNPEEERIIIELDKESKKIDVGEIEESREKKILNSKINSFYKGNSGLSSYFESGLKFPEGIEKGFRIKYAIDLGDEFLNSILENNRYFILSSKSGKIFLTDRFTGKINESIFFENETFEKTGLVFENRIYINSLKKIYELGKIGISKQVIYSSSDNQYIWSNLNRHEDKLVFSEYDPGSGNASFKAIRLNENHGIKEFNFKVRSFLSDSLCIAFGKSYLLSDEKLIEYDFGKSSGEIFDTGIETNENSIMFFSNGRLYLTTSANELYYLDLPSDNYKFRYTGIKDPYLNSAGGFADNLFTGTIDGWKFFKAGGMQVFRFDDESENKIECISKNVLVVSQKNKIVFCNLNRFQEAESSIISSENENKSEEIVSALISGNEIAVLTTSGLLKVFTNDKLNIHI